MPLVGEWVGGSCWSGVTKLKWGLGVIEKYR